MQPLRTGVSLQAFQGRVISDQQRLLKTDTNEIYGVTGATKRQPVTDISGPDGMSSLGDKLKKTGQKNLFLKVDDHKVINIRFSLTEPITRQQFVQALAQAIQNDGGTLDIKFKCGLAEVYTKLTSFSPEPVPSRSRVLDTMTLLATEMQMRVGGISAPAYQSPAEHLDHIIDGVWAQRSTLPGKAATSGYELGKQIYYDFYANELPKANQNPVTGDQTNFVGDLHALAKKRPPEKSYLQVAGTQISDLTSHTAATAFGDFLHFEALHPTEVRERVFINVKGDNAVALMKDLVPFMDESSGIEKTKVFGPKYVGKYPDSIVVYTNGREATQKVLEHLKSLQQMHQTWFGDETPLMTEQVMPGVSISDEPLSEVSEGGAKSFGQVRSDAIAAALQLNPTSREEFRELVFHELEKRHITPDEVGRNERPPLDIQVASEPTISMPEQSLTEMSSMEPQPQPKKPLMSSFGLQQPTLSMRPPRQQVLEELDDELPPQPKKPLVGPSGLSQMSTPSMRQPVDDTLSHFMSSMKPPPKKSMVSSSGPQQPTHVMRPIKQQTLDELDDDLFKSLTTKKGTT